MSDLSAAEIADFLRARRRARTQHDAGAELLAVLFIGYAHALHVEHLGMAIQEFLHFAWIDVLTAANHHVLGPADDAAVPGLVDDGKIPAVHPAAGVDRFPRTLVIVPVAAHHGIAAGEQLSR